jgi:hypothetical protein
MRRHREELVDLDRREAGDRNVQTFDHQELRELGRSVPLSACQSCPGYATITSGHDFRKVTPAPVSVAYQSPNLRRGDDIPIPSANTNRFAVSSDLVKAAPTTVSVAGKRDFEGGEKRHPVLIHALHHAAALIHHLYPVHVTHHATMVRHAGFRASRQLQDPPRAGLPAVQAYFCVETPPSMFARTRGGSRAM